MKRPLLLLCVLGQLAPITALACGDKFFNVGRGTRFQRSPRAAHPARILAYARPGSNVAATMLEKGFVNSLKGAGHKIKVATEAAAFSAELRHADYDLALIDLGDVATLETQTSGLAQRPSALPVLFDPSLEELAAARGRFACVLNLKGQEKSVLDVVDEAMRLRKRPESYGLEVVR